MARSWRAVVLKAATLGAILAVIAGACDRRRTVYVEPVDTSPPAVPTGVTTTTMDGAVLVEWDPVIERDMAGYMIYRSNNNEIFTHIATVNPSETEYMDTDVVNGLTYYYAVSSFDSEGNESELSLENAFDTPRPEGFDVRIYSYTDPAFEQLSGFDFSSELRVSWNHPRCDFHLEYDDTPGVDAYFLWLGENGYRIQDMGYTDSFDDITYAPADGWSLFDYVEAIPGHTYVIWTVDDHYAKVRVHDFALAAPYSILFDWGYQVDPGNRELIVVPSAGLMAEDAD